MKLAQLFESPKDEIKLQEIAQAVVRYVQDKVAQGIQEQYVELKLSDLPKGTLGHLYARLRAMEVVFLFRDNGDVAGEYSQWGRSVKLFARRTANPATGKDELMDVDALTSTLVHELRHALDHSLRGRKKFDDRNEYWERPHEINARFSEAQRVLVTKLKDSIANGSPLSLREFIHQFEIIAVKYKLMQLFDRDNEMINNFVHFIENGAFGRPLPHHMVKGLVTGGEGKDLGAFSDKRYRGLIRRLSGLYYHVIESNKKAR